jgi:phosphatidylserine/phosphatidylglycerophosphate/cardiolipin synthase-like enzyme
MPDWLLYILIAAAVVAAVVAMVAVAFWFDAWAGSDDANSPRTRFRRVSDRYSAVAQQLDGLDARAHSLASPAAEAELRRRWQECRDAFLEVDRIVQATGLTPDSPGREFRRHTGEIRTADAAAARMQQASDAVDRLLALERDDPAGRYDRLTDLIGDINEAEADHWDSAWAYPQLQHLEEQVRQLREEASGTPDTAGLLDRVVTVTRDLDDITARAGQETA